MASYKINYFLKDHHGFQYVLNLSSWEKKPEKILGLNGDQTHDFCNAGAVLYQLSYQANWELITWCSISVQACYAMCCLPWRKTKLENSSVSCLYTFVVINNLFSVLDCKTFLKVQCIWKFSLVFNKLTSVFHGSVLLLIMNFIITLSK